MTLQETKDIILKWIKSCETDEQLDLMLDVIDRFVFEKFAGLVYVVEYDSTKTEIFECMDIQRKMVVQNYNLRQEYPTLFLNKNIV